VRTICAAPILPQPVDCGVPAFDANGQPTFIPILAVGNDDLELEKTASWELGYTGLLASKVFLTLDYYKSKNTNFITDLVPQVGTVLGNLEGCVDLSGAPQTDPTLCPINNDYRPWVSTPEAETTLLFGTLTVAQALRNAVENSVGGSTLGFRLAQDLDGNTVVIGRTYTNVGEVKTQGVDFGLQYFITPSMSLQASYSWFDFQIDDVDEKVRNILLPNSPEHKGSLAFAMTKKRWAFSISGRWVQGFRWSAGVYEGEIPDYSTVDLSASYAFNDHFRLGLNVANLRDSVHFEAFGGDLLERRALLNLTAQW
jgi:outer membrane receptor protein involved in Fe transport